MNIDAAQIPDAAAFALNECQKDPEASPWDLIAAALSAWPGACIRTRVQPDPKNGGQWTLPVPMLSLPFTKEGQQFGAKLEKIRRRSGFKWPKGAPEDGR